MEQCYYLIVIIYDNAVDGSKVNKANKIPSVHMEHHINIL